MLNEDSDNIILNKKEKAYIMDCLKSDLRLDGRHPLSYRPIIVKTGVLDQSYGSCKVRIARKEVLVSVKLELVKPHIKRPNEGILEFHVDCSSSAARVIEKKESHLTTDIASYYTTLFHDTKAIDLKELCVYRKLKCWKVIVDIMILEYGIYIYDCIAVAVKVALFDTKIPKVDSFVFDGRIVDFQVSKNDYYYHKIDVSRVPVMVTVCRILEYYVVDSSIEEEYYSRSSVLVSVVKNKITSSRKLGPMSVRIETCVDRSYYLGLKAGIKLQKSLNKLLNRIVVKESKEKNKIIIIN